MSLFEIEIRTSDSAKGQYEVLTPDGEAQIQQVSFDNSYLDAPIGQIQNPLWRLYARGITAFGPPPFTEFGLQESVCVEIGKRLFNCFLVGSTRKKFSEYKAANRPRLMLRLTPELYHLPWELLHDPEDDYGQFLAIQGSIVRSDSATQPRLFHPLKSSSLLFILASPQDKIAIADFNLSNVGQFEFIKVTPATYDKFTELAANKGHFGLVFFGHGEVDEKKDGCLVFVREERRKFILTRLLSDPKYGHSLGDALGWNAEMHLACIFACESAWSDKAVQFDRSIVGACLKRTKLAFVIGAQTPIDLFAAQECLAGILKGLADEDTLDLALTKGRIAIRSLAPDDPGGKSAPMDWWIPVLYSKTANLDIIPRESVRLPEGMSQRESSLQPASLAIKSVAELTDFGKALAQKLTHVISGDSGRLRNL